MQEEQPQLSKVLQLNRPTLGEDGKEIRLITLRWVEVKPQQSETSELEVHDALSCDLENCPFHGHDALPGVGDSAAHLPPANSYVALSYTWNQDGHVKDLKVNGHTVSIGKNLADAIQVFQRTHLAKDGYKLWADALCIDQSSIIERNREVPRMREIYQRARYVFSWLGPAEDDSDLVLDFVNGLSAVWNANEQSARSFLQTTLTAQGHRLFKAMTRFIQRRYWLRVWVIQELALGSDDSLIFCGNRSTTWGNILLTYRACNLRLREFGSALADVFQDEFTKLPSNVREHYWREMIYWQWGKVEAFSEIQEQVRAGNPILTKLVVSRTRHSGCTRPEDKVYGVLGLLNKSISSRLHTDYSLPYIDTYRMFARACIEGEQNLEVLHWCGNDSWTTGHTRPFEEDQPSWVPDLSFSKRVMNARHEPDYNAHGATKPEVSFPDDGRVLTAKGVLFDILDGVGGNRVREDDFSQANDIVSSTSNANGYGSTEAAAEAFWRALLGNRDRAGQTAPASYSCLLDSLIMEDPASSPPPDDSEFPQDLLWHVHLFFKRHADFVLCGRPLRDYFRDHGSFADAPDRRVALIEHFRTEGEQYFNPFRRMMDFMWSRRFAQTKDGYIAVVPNLAKPGDVIAVLYGSSYPILLRPFRGKYKVVGHCFVQGIMDGEVLDMIASGVMSAVDVHMS
ncbi:uncharacterized protein CLAFUR5_10296 [Fulvia fulva]|uniref:Heterokaryon incompatibility domain-containing protein n=1 Tax=Passalora fulva TaxID=5499 RepID=A0A9Q8PCV1_PASFU|nr:uncharacterized protein CLAFUR5_10296 [Fulvia fulva]UJO20196.1 hypothetical protein CLAFUR5_10296 [Fulvia fulva]